MIEELIKESDAHFQHKLFTAHVGYLQVTDETNGQDGEDCHDEPGHHHWLGYGKAAENGDGKRRFAVQLFQ